MDASRGYLIKNHDAMKFSVNFNTALQCWYCGKFYAITGISNHLLNNCKKAMEATGKNTQERDKKRKIQRQQKYLKTNLDFDICLERNKKLWERDLKANEPTHYLYDWLSVENYYPLYIHEESIPDKSFSLILKEKLFKYMIRKNIRLIATDDDDDSDFDFFNATNEQHLECKKKILRFYRHLSAIFHSDW